MQSSQTEGTAHFDRSPAYAQGTDAVLTIISDDNADLDSSAYELLVQWLGHKGAHRLRRFMAENAQYDENSYLCLSNLLDAVTLRAAASIPSEMAAADLQLQCTFGEKTSEIKTLLDGFLNKLPEKLDQIHVAPSHRQPAAPVSVNAHIHRVSTLRATHLKNALTIWTTFCIRHTLFIVGSMGILMLFVVASVVWNERLREQQARKQDVINMATWKNQMLEKENAWYAEQIAQTAQEREQNLMEAQRQIFEQTNRRFEQLVPATYRLAEQFERSARKISLPGEPQAWEITLAAAQGLIDGHLEFLDGGRIFKLYLRTEPDRLALSATTTSPEASAVKGNARSKSH